MGPILRFLGGSDAKVVGCSDNGGGVVTEDKLEDKNMITCVPQLVRLVSYSFTSVHLF
jgi:hypothetical protein